jgi:hypothetical protein
MLTIYCFIQSTGPYVVSWSLKKIRLGQIYNYVIKKYDDIVVSDNFVYGNDNNIIVAVSIINSLSILTRKNFHTHVLLFCSSALSSFQTMSPPCPRNNWEHQKISWLHHPKTCAHALKLSMRHIDSLNLVFSVMYTCRTLNRYLVIARII